MLRYKHTRIRFILLVLVLIIPLIAFGVVGIINDYKDKIKSEYRMCENLAKSISTSFLNYLDGMRNAEKQKGNDETCQDLSVDRINKYLNTIRYKNKFIDTNFQLISDDGIIVYDSKKNNNSGNPIHPENNKPANILVNGEPSGNIEAGIYSDNNDSKNISVSYTIPTINWICRVYSDYNAVMADYFDKLTNDIFVLLVIILFYISFAVILNNSYQKPFEELHNAVQKIMSGDFAARIKIEPCYKDNDEVVHAIKAFNDMVKKLEHWNLIKSQHFINMYHELKTPLNVIFASVQLIENFKISDDPEFFASKVHRQLKIIRQNCYRLIRLTNNLVDLSRYDSGYYNIQMGNHDIVELSKKITQSIERYTEAKGINLRFVSEIKSKIIACDPDLIERILLNLISNAIKFTDENGCITVSIKNDCNFVLIEVEDTGIGIPEDKLSIIFDRYKQVDGNYIRNREGSGIGLSLVKVFTEAHGGNISVTSANMKGTTFHIRLPAKKLITNQISEVERNFSTSRAPFIVSTGEVSRINIEFSDIYSGFDD
jgi:signal transduction histidine kinase